MAEIIVFASTNTTADPVGDIVGSWKRGYIVEVGDDGRDWGKEVDPANLIAPRKFALIKLPGIPASRVIKYAQPQYVDPAVDPVNFRRIVRRRLWQIQFSELPAAVKTKLANTGVLTIAPTGGDFTWAQAKGFFMRLDTSARETADITQG